ncbi:MAG: class I SAM-dependent methyltransferase [Solirubrobacteraceae bacterium]
MSTDDKHITELSVERATPDEMAGRLMESEHRGRYWWAGQLAEGREVLDAGCGTGYGTEILAGAGAQRVVGIDRSHEALEDARSSFSGSAREFSLADLHQLPFEDSTFDLAVCFEVIEHVEDQQQAITELRRVLRPGGLLAISSPNRDVYPPGNPHHTHEFVPEELAQVLTSEFANVKLYRQSAWLAAAILNDEQSRAVGIEAELMLRVVKIGSVEPGDEVFTVALASNGELPEPEALVTMGKPFEVGWWEGQLDGATSERNQLRSELVRKDAERDEERRERDGERAERDEERRERGRALLAVETGLANAQNQIVQLNALETELRKWATEQMAKQQRLLWQTEQDRRDFENRLRRAEGTIDDITGSLTWRVTAPLRAVKRRLRSWLS